MYAFPPQNHSSRMLQNIMQRGATETWRDDVDKYLGTTTSNLSQAQAHSLAARRLQEVNGFGSVQSDSLPAGSGMGGLCSDHQLLLALQRNQFDAQALLRLQSPVDREALLGLSSQNPGYSGLASGHGGANDRLLLQLLNERQRQQASMDPFQQEIQRQALARELAEREYERTLLQRLQAVGGAQGLGHLGGGENSLGLSQGSLLEQARLSSLFGGGGGAQLPSPLLQGNNAGGAAPGNQGLTRGRAPGSPPFTFDDSITLEARSKQAFPLKLYRMLERAERNGQDDIISFIDDGKAFAIHKPRAFETDIMPSYFNSHRMSSFQRQLNIYVSLKFCGSHSLSTEVHPGPHMF